MLKEIISVIKKDVALEWRNKFSIAGILVQVLTSVFIIYLAIPAMNAATQNSLFWIVVIFSSLNPLAKGFLGESAETAFYYKQLIAPKTAIIAKLIYNFALIILIVCIIWLGFQLLLDPFKGNAFAYFITILLAGLGISSTFTLMSSLLTKIKNAFLILPVISLPIIIPILLIGIKAAKKAVDEFPTNLFYKDWLLLGMLVIFSCIMTVIFYTVLEKN